MFKTLGETACERRKVNGGHPGSSASALLARQSPPTALKASCARVKRILRRLRAQERKGFAKKKERTLFLVHEPPTSSGRADVFRLTVGRYRACPRAKKITAFSLQSLSGGVALPKAQSGDGRLSGSCLKALRIEHRPFVDADRQAPLCQRVRF